MNGLRTYLQASFLASRAELLRYQRALGLGEIVVKLSLQGMPLAGAAAAFLFGVCAAAHADDRTLIELKAKLFDARVAVKTFAMGLPFCKELNGTNFFYEPRRRVLNLADYQ